MAVMAEVADKQTISEANTSFEKNINKNCQK